MLEIKDIDKVKIRFINEVCVQFDYEDVRISLDKFKNDCTVITTQVVGQEKKYQIIECKIEKFMTKLTLLGNIKTFHFDLYKNDITKENICDFILCLESYGIIKCDKVKKEKINIKIIKTKTEIIDIERKILDLTREKQIKEVALHELEATRRNFLGM